MGHVGVPPVLAVVGLRAEAQIARSALVSCLCGGGQSQALGVSIKQAIDAGARAIISFGIAGGCAPGLKPGAVIVANCVVDPDGGRLAVDPNWTGRLRAKAPFALEGVLAGVNQPVPTAAGKAHLHQNTGAVAVDMESHIAARIAVEHGLPFAALRVVADDARRVLPPAALVGMKSDGNTDIGAVLRSLMKQPGQLPALLLTALEAGRAMSELKRSRRLLDDSFEYLAA